MRMAEIGMQKPPEPGALQGANILLVDDHTLYLDSVQHILQAVGARVTIARNGVEALGLLRAGSFCCVLTDVLMPVMDGIEMAKEIRATPAVADVTLIAMSCNATGQLRELCLSAGADDFIAKPFKAEELISTLAARLV